MLKSIKIKERLPIWSLRLVLGAVLLVFSELIMWQNPTARLPIEWLALLILYVALAAILLDVTVRFQAHDPAALLLVSGLYGLANAVFINHNGLSNLPITLLVQAMGLQTGAALYGLLFFISVMRGKQPHILQILAAGAVGILWGVWIHWYPIQLLVNWGPVAQETGQFYLLIGLGLVGLIFVLVPRFRTFREPQLALLWWEMIIVGVPLFTALLIGTIQNTVPFGALIIIVAVGGVVVYALNYQRHGYDPSIMAEITFASPNLITYLVLSVIFLAAGTLAYTLVIDGDSVIGVIMYYLVLGFGTLWLPLAFLLIFWRTLRARSAAMENQTSTQDQNE